jgi:hypothetical protein
MWIIFVVARRIAPAPAMTDAQSPLEAVQGHSEQALLTRRKLLG